MAARDPALEPFAMLIGTWATESRHRLVDGVVTGTTIYEWLEGEQFIVVRSEIDHELFPTSISVIGRPEDGEGLVMEWFDSRGVRRTYRTSFDDGWLRVWRDHEGFDQKSVARPAPDTFEMFIELAEVPGEWREDMRTLYRRVA